MAPFGNRSVKAKLILASILGSGAALLIVGTVIAGYDFLTLRRGLIRSMSIQADIAAINCQSALLFADPKSAETTLGALKADPRVLGVALYGADGRRFAAYAGASRAAPALGDARALRDGYALMSDRLLVYRKVMFEGQPIGTVVVMSDPGEITASIARDLLLFAGLLLGSMALGLTISSRLQRDISQPILELARIARCVTVEKDYAVRSFGGRRDEIGALTTAFNEMLDVIGRREAELRAAHDELEERVESRTAQLQAANEELEAFSYSVSHDLRAPVRHIAGFSELLEAKSGGLNDDARRYLDKIRQAAHRMGRLIDDLLVFSRMGRAEMRRTRIDLNALVAEVVKEIQPDVQRPIDWRIGPLPCVLADHALLRAALTNLISNAIKYSGKSPAPRIEIGAAPAGAGETAIVVRDNGVGFDMTYAPKLFGVFQRLHRAEEFEGTGIGLASVRRIIQKHGGRTWAEGQPGRGAAFYISLPADREAAA